MSTLDEWGTTTRTVRLTLDLAFGAYLAWLDATGQKFDLQAFDLFAAGYRAAQVAARSPLAEGE